MQFSQIDSDSLWCISSNPYLEAEQPEPPVDEHIECEVPEAWPSLRWRRGRGTLKEDPPPRNPRTRPGGQLGPCQV